MQRSKPILATSSYFWCKKELSLNVEGMVQTLFYRCSSSNTTFFSLPHPLSVTVVAISLASLLLTWQAIFVIASSTEASDESKT